MSVSMQVPDIVEQGSHSPVIALVLMIHRRKMKRIDIIVLVEVNNTEWVWAG